MAQEYQNALTLLRVSLTECPIRRSDGGRKRSLRRKTKNGGKWSTKHKKSIDCKSPRGFSQRQYCKYGRRKTAKK